jgi:hypothetical protein
MSIAGEFIRRVPAGTTHTNHGTASQANVLFGGFEDYVRWGDSTAMLS